MTAPAPEITSVQTYEAGWDQWPTGPRTLAAHAQKHGWAVRVGFSRGPVPGRAAGSWKTADLIGVWVDGYGCRAVAWWIREPLSNTVSAQEWGADCTAIWTAPGAPFPYANTTEFREWLSVQGAVLPAFWSTARERVLAARAKAKARTAVSATRDHA